MVTTVKLPPELEHSLRQRCAQEGRTISDVMRDALQFYLSATPRPSVSAYHMGADLFGRHAGPADLASKRHEHAASVWGRNGHVADSGPLS